MTMDIYGWPGFSLQIIYGWRESSIGSRKVAMYHCTSKWQRWPPSSQVVHGWPTGRPRTGYRGPLVSQLAQLPCIDKVVATQRQFWSASSRKLASPTFVAAPVVEALLVVVEYRVECVVRRLRHAPTGQSVRKPVEFQQVQILDKLLIWLLLCNDRCPWY